MYINFWYPVILGRDLDPEKPEKVRILGQDLVVFRGADGNARVLSETCVHRGGSLSGGKIKGDCIQCPYHGWQFDGAGQCRKIPSMGADAKIPGRTRIDAYPVEERYGIVFAFLGDLPEQERPPIMPIPTYGQEGWRETHMVYEVPINYERSIENGIDPAHNEFVHPSHGSAGENAEYRMDKIRIIDEDETGDGYLVRQDLGFGFFAKMPKSPKSKDKEMARFKKAAEEREAGSGTLGPNHLWTIIRFSPEAEFRQYMFEAPIDETNVRIFLVNLRCMLLEDEHDERVNAMNWTIAKQDIDVLSDLHPKLTPPTNTKEFMVPADRVILLYREKLKLFEARGWRMDFDAINDKCGKVAYAIPSPARREHKGWVLDSVPLMPGSVDSPQLKAARG